MRAKALLLTAAFAICAPQIAVACGKCEYKDSLTHMCHPKIGCSSRQLDPINPVVQATKIVTIATAIAQGNSGQIKASLGDALLNSSTCFSCPALAHTLVPNLSDEQINRIVGEGALVFAGTYDPVLVTVNVATNVAHEQKIAKERTALPAPSAAPEQVARVTKTYSADAKCLVTQDGDGMVYAAWTEPAAFTDDGGSVHQYPNVDLLPGDIVKVTAPLCPAWDNPTASTRALTSASLAFEAVSSLTGDEKTLKWFVAGKIYK